MGYIGSVSLLIAILVTRSIYMTFGDPSVCSIPVRKEESRYTPYTETYQQRAWNIFRGTYYKTLTRRNYKIVINSFWDTIPTCCDGYREVSKVCVPYCEKGCVNGNCTAPDTCSCYDGYISASNRSMNHVCEAFCKTCANGACIAPGVCNCTKGYLLNGTEENHTCVPICKVPCGPGGTCTAPDTCSCFEGYQLRETNAEVNETEILEERTSGCDPTCNQTCENGTCSTAPDVCTCNDGYLQEGFNPTSKPLCMPFCENCENGECVAPNECQCRSGFKPNENNNSCIKPCTRACKGHGVCIEDDKPCKCSYGWTGWECDQPIVCILLMDRQDKNLEGLTIYNETNSTLMDARRYAPYCYQCNETVGSGNFCFAINSNNELATVGCFVETDSPCYMLYHSNTDAVSRMAGTLAAVTILIIVAATAAAYFVHRRYQRRKLNLTAEESLMYQASATNEPLLRKEENFSTLTLDDIEK